METIKDCIEIPPDWNKCFIENIIPDALVKVDRDPNDDQSIFVQMNDRLGIWTKIIREEKTVHLLITYSPHLNKEEFSLALKEIKDICPDAEINFY